MASKSTTTSGFSVCCITLRRSPLSKTCGFSHFLPGLFFEEPLSFLFSSFSLRVWSFHRALIPFTLYSIIEMGSLLIWAMPKSTVAVLSLSCSIFGIPGAPRAARISCHFFAGPRAIYFLAHFSNCLAKFEGKSPAKDGCLQKFKAVAAAPSGKACIPLPSRKPSVLDRGLVLSLILILRRALIVAPRTLCQVSLSLPIS